jgi:hypothetical protein
LGSDDEPIYDHVASDDDYYNIPDASEESSKSNNTLPRLKSSPSLQSSPAKSSNSSHSASKNLKINPSSEYYALKQQLENSEQKVQALIDSNDDMRQEISRLSTMVNKLVNENHVLRSSSVENEYATPQIFKPAPPIRSNTTTVTSSANNSPMSRLAGPSSLPGQPQPRVPSYHNSPAVSNVGEDEKSNSLPYDYFQHQQQVHHNPNPQSLPSQEEVVRRTEAITRCIQELLISAKDEKFDAFIPCSERIVRAVTDMVSLFPTEDDEDESLPWGRSPLGMALADLMAAAHHFETECRILIARSQKEPLHQGFVTQQVIQCAFDIAKSTKQLVAMFQ